MKLFLIVAVQWLHVVAGLVWLGGQAFSVLVLWPALLRRPAGEARAVVDALARPAGRVMGVAGMLVVILGVLRGTWLGPVRSWRFLLTTPYGLTFLAAFALTILIGAHDGAVRSRLESRVWDGVAYHREAERFLRRHGVITMVGLSAVLACMVLMRFGL